MAKRKKNGRQTELSFPKAKRVHVRSYDRRPPRPRKKRK